MKKTIPVILILILILVFGTFALPARAASEETGEEIIYESFYEAATYVQQATQEQTSSVTVRIAFDSEESANEAEMIAERNLKARSLDTQIRRQLGLVFSNQAIGEKPWLTVGVCTSNVTWYPYSDRCIAEIEYCFEYLVLDNVSDAVVALTDAWTAKKTTLTMYVKASLNEGENEYDRMYSVWNELVALSGTHTGNPEEGDSLKRYLRTNGHNQTNYYVENGEYVVGIFISFEDYITDGTFDRELDRVMDSLDLEGKSEYEKVFAIYSYITSTVTYDVNDENPRRYMAYGALVDKLAVCDGISQLVYRMMLSAGIDCRIILGSVLAGYSSESHSWNIVRIGSYYYNLDATWDTELPYEGWSWFLLSNYTFERGHNPPYNPYNDPYYYEVFHYWDPEYKTDEFTISYPISPLDYNDDSVWMLEGEIYDVSLDENDSRTFVFKPSKSGRYTLRSINASQEACVTITSIKEPLDVREFALGKDFDNVYRLIEGEEYRFTISLHNREQTGNLSVRITKDTVEEVTITAATVDDYTYYEGDWVYAWGTYGTFQNYSPMKAAAEVSLSNGEVLRGSLGYVIEQLNDVYELDVPVKAAGDFQRSTYQWGIGSYPLSIQLGDIVVEFNVIIRENPVKSVETEPLPPIYDDDYIDATFQINPDGSVTQLSYRYYLFDPGNITVITDEKTYEGPYEDVYNQVCEDMNYAFPHIPEITLQGGTEPGLHDVDMRMFGVQASWHTEILFNPIQEIRAANRTVTENDRFEEQIEIPDGSGGTSIVTFLAYPHEPLSVTVILRDGGSFTGTPEEVMAYLSEEYGFDEEFHYNETDSYESPWTYGQHPISISMRKKTAEYIVSVMSINIVSLPENGSSLVEITKAGKMALLSFIRESGPYNEVFKIYSSGISFPSAAYLFDDEMNLLMTDNAGGENTDFSFSWEYVIGKTYYVGVIFCGEQTGTIEVTSEDKFGISITTIALDNGGNPVELYENEAIQRKVIVDGEAVQYMWYDLYQRYTIGFIVVTDKQHYTFSGSLDEASTFLQEPFGVDLKFSVVNYQSYSNPWTAEGVYDSYVHFWGNNYSGPNIRIKPGPILSMEAEDVVRIAGTGEMMTHADGSVWYRYDPLPEHLTAHTADGDIQGSPEEILQHLKDTYGITPEFSCSDDGQSWETPWGAGAHDMTFMIGNVSASYRVFIDTAESISVSGEYRTDYFAGDVFDSTGITVTAAMSSGNTVDVTADASFSGFDSTSAGEKTVTVRYGDLETTFTVTVRNRVTLSVLGDAPHTVESTDDVHGLLAGGLTEWLSPTEYAADSGESAYGLIVRVLGGGNALTAYHRPGETDGVEYIYAVERSGLTLTEGQNHDNSRWMVAVNGTPVQGPAASVVLADRDSVTLYWCDDPAWDMTADMWQAAVVTAMIEAIGELTPESEPAIVAAWMAYEALTAEQKAFVTNHSLLIIAQETVTYTVDYDANGGTGAPTSQSKTLGYPLTLHTEIPVRADMSEEGYVVTFDANGGSVDTEQLTNERTTVYTFTQWNTAADGSGTGYAPGGEYSGNADVTMYAQWTEDTITASVMLPTPTRDGYTFKGWGTSADATRGVTGHYTPSGDETLYAVWERNAPETYTVTYDANGGTGAPDDQIKTHGTDLTLSRTEPTRADAPAGSFTVTLDANGGIVDPAELYAERTTKYAFETWNTEPDGSGTNFKPGEKYKANESVTLYAQWTEDTITASVTLPTPTREGYTFDGWGSSTAADTGITGSFTPWESGKLYALWKEDSVPQDRFTDVPEDSWYSDAVYWAKENGITTGTTPTTFSPNAACTRAQIVTFLWRVKGEPEPRSYANPFRDVPSDKFYYKAVLWAYHAGITTGTSETTFGPNAVCTRAQSVTFLWRAAGSPNAAVGNKFKDVKGDAWYAKAVYWAYNNGITTGTSGTAFSPNASCSRAQIVTFLYRYAG